MTHPWGTSLGVERCDVDGDVILGAHDLVLLYESDLGHHADAVDGLLAEVARVPLDVPVVDMVQASRELAAEGRALLVSHL